MIANNRIGWIDDLTGLLRYPSAEEVYDAVFEPPAADQEPQNDTPQSLAPLKFSRFPLDPVLRVYGTSYDHLSARVGFFVEGKFFSVEEISDQYIINNIWYPAQREVIHEYLEILADVGASDGLPLTIGSLTKLRSKFSAGDEINLVDEIALNSDSIAIDISTKWADVPNLKANLYPYQRDGIAFLQTMASQGIGCLLGDEMGLGKTLQAIGLMQSEKNAGRTRSLVVSPATLVENWRRELCTFAPNLNVLVHRGPQRAGIPSAFEDCDLVVTSFETMIRDELILSKIDWNLLILDEAQNIKNPETQRTRVAKRLRRRISIAITGTPVENRLEDLWSISDFILPGYLGDVSQFRRYYDDNLNDASVLGTLMAPLMLRRRVASVANDLPPRLDIPQPLEMDSILASRYENIRTADEAGTGSATAMVIAGRLRSLCAKASVTDDSSLHRTDLSPKFIRLTELLEELFLIGDKVVIFASFHNTIDDLKCRLKSQWQDAWISSIDGRTPVEVRQALIDSFSTFSGPGAIILNPRAAGVGLNITAANHVVHFNPEWNPALMAQASARVHRRTQTRPVSVFYLYYVNTIEEVIRDRSQFKNELAEEATQGTDGAMDQVSLARALTVSPFQL